MSIDLTVRSSVGRARCGAALLLAFAFLIGCEDSDDPPTPTRDCQAVRDREIATRVARLEQMDATPAVIAAHREQLLAAVGDDLVARCLRERGVTP